jgi:hypothetical protein
MSSTSRRASQTRSSRTSNGADASAAGMSVDRSDVDADVNEIDEATWSVAAASITKILREGKVGSGFGIECGRGTWP